MSKNDDEIAPARRVKRTYIPESQEGADLLAAQNEERNGGISDQAVQSRRTIENVTASLPAQTEDETDPGMLTRRARGGEGDTRLDIPEEYKRPGWDYEYKTARVMGQDVDSSDTAQIYEGGWRPVLAGSMPKLNAPGYTGKYITRLGQILYTRPMHLTEEARTEAYELAETQKFDKLMSASAVPVGDPSKMRSVKTEMNIEGVIGTHRAQSKGASA